MEIPNDKLVRGLGSLDATMIVIGSMIGSGIFITSAESTRLISAPGWLLLASSPSRARSAARNWRQ
jgi:APA family basic amino acid/polyamine antiporter